MLLTPDLAKNILMFVFQRIISNNQIRVGVGYYLIGMVCVLDKVIDLMCLQFPCAVIPPAGCSKWNNVVNSKRDS